MSTINLETKQALAVRKVAAPMLRKHNITAPERHSLHALSWRSLNDLEADIKREAAAMIDKIKEGGDEKAAELENAHDGLMAMFDAVISEKDIRSAAGDRGPRSSSHHPMAPIPRDGVASAIDGQEPYKGDPAEASTALRNDQRMSDWLVESRRSDAAEYRNLMVGDYLRAMVLGPKNALEKRALSEGSDSAGGFTVPDVLSARLIDRLRAASTVIQAGAQTVPLGSDVNYVAKLLTDPVPAWRAENAAIPESDPTFGRVTMTARALGVIVRVSRELLEDSVNISTALPNILASAMAAELDRVALLGSGTAPEPRGVANFAGLTASGFSGGAIDYASLVQARSKLRTVNSDVTAFIMHPREEGDLAAALDSNGQPVVIPPFIANIPRLVTSKIAINGGAATNESSIFAGDWSKLMIGIRTNLTIEVLRERYADSGQYAFLAFARCDVAAEHEAAFTKLTGITPN